MTNKNFNFILLLLLSFPCIFLIAQSQATDFIQTECRTTRYPSLCVQCLSNYSSSIQQNPRQMAQAALSVSLSQTQSAASFITKLTRMSSVKPMEYRAVKDCLENMGDTVDQLNRSVKELGGMDRVGTRHQDFDWHMSNVQTWVSAALTNENTCLDGFAGAGMNGNVKVAIRRRILGCAQVTSNVLALVNRFAAKRKVDISSKSTTHNL